jgi:hypothetical protein
MSAAVAMPLAGDHFTVSSVEGPLGALEVEAVFQDGTVRGRFTITNRDSSLSKTLGFIRDLASAADDLAFAVMAVHEESLKGMGLSLLDEKSQRTMLLGHDFQGLFFDPELTTMAFIVRSPGQRPSKG